MRVQVPGRLVAVVDETFNFDGDDGRPVNFRRAEAYVATVFTEAPARLVVNTRDETPAALATVDAFEQLLDAEQFCPITCIVDVSNKGKFTFVSATVGK